MSDSKLISALQRRYTHHIYICYNTHRMLKFLEQQLTIWAYTACCQSTFIKIFAE